MRFDEVVADFIHEHLISGVDRAARDDVAGLIVSAGQHVKILPERFRCGVDEEALPFADDARKGKKERELPRNDLRDPILLRRDDVDVVAAEDEVFGDLPREVRRLLGRGMAYNAIESRLH